MEDLWQRLAEQGVLVLAFAVAITVLWKTNRDRRVFYEGDPKEPEKTPGKIAELAKAAQAREDEIRAAGDAALEQQRKDYAESLKNERAEQKLVMDQLLAALRGDPQPPT